MLVSPRRFIGALALVLVVMSGAAAAQSTRTPFDRLALDSPEAAVARFVDAYRQRDYVTVYWILSPAAQKAWTDDFYVFNMEPLIAKLPAGRQSEILMTGIPPMDQWDQQDGSWLFDRIMVTSEAAGALPVQMPQNGTAGKPQPRADGAVTIGFGQGATAVKFRLVRAPSGQWRVFSVSAGGGNPDRAPWGLGKTD
jgi:hypothetical protein